jgi:tetratricopeptide (TPR) repeat protein
MVGRRDAAIQLLLVAIRNSPNNYILHEALSQTYLFLGRFDEAIATARIAIATDPNVWSTYTSLAAAYLDVNRPKEAIEPAIEAARVGPDISFGYARAGEALRRSGDLDRAQEYAHAALRIRPEGHQPLMGRVLMTLGQWRDAEAEFQRAYSQYPQFWGVSFYHALTLIPQGRTDEAAHLLEGSLRNNPCLRLPRLLWERIESWKQHEVRSRDAIAASPRSSLKIDTATMLRLAITDGEANEPRGIILLEEELLEERLKLIEAEVKQQSRAQK